MCGIVRPREQPACLAVARVFFGENRPTRAPGRGCDAPWERGPREIRSLESCRKLDRATHPGVEVCA
jgi:hypothetical protein